MREISFGSGGGPSSSVDMVAEGKEGKTKDGRVEVSKNVFGGSFRNAAHLLTFLSLSRGTGRDGTRDGTGRGTP